MAQDLDKTRNGQEKKKTTDRTERERAIHIVFTAGALCVLALSFILSPAGFMIYTCTFKALTGCPCPGCGLTRSVINISHLNFLTAFRLNPMGYPIYLTLLFLSVYNFLPEKQRTLVDRFLIRHHRIWIIIGISGIALLISIWIFRMLIVRDQHHPFLEEL